MICFHTIAFDFGEKCDFWTLMSDFGHWSQIVVVITWIAIATVHRAVVESYEVLWLDSMGFFVWILHLGENSCPRGAEYSFFLV